MNLHISQQDNKFIITENGRPILFPNMPNEFSSLQDAVRAIDIIKTQDYVANLLRGYGL